MRTRWVVVTRMRGSTQIQRVFWMWVICLGRGEESGEYTRCDFMYMVVVISFLFVLGTKGRMQPVVMAPKNLSTKH